MRFFFSNVIGFKKYCCLQDPGGSLILCVLNSCEPLIVLHLFYATEEPKYILQNQPIKFILFTIKDMGGGGL